MTVQTPSKALSPQFDNAKFEQIHGNSNSEAIIVDAKELQKIDQTLNKMSKNLKLFNEIIQDIHHSNKNFEEVSPEETLEIHLRQNDINQIQHVDPSEQNSSATGQPMKHDSETQIKDTEFSSAMPQPMTYDATTQTTETDIGFSSATATAIQTSSDINTATKDQLFFQSNCRFLHHLISW